MQTRIAAGDDLPDSMLLVQNVVTLGTSGVIASLNDMIDQFVPNLQRYYKENPDLKASLTVPDGNIYAITTDIKGSRNPFTYHIREDWLNTLNLEAPETLDEWYNVLKTFKEKDPNNNGKADEIPYAALNED